MTNMQAGHDEPQRVVEAFRGSAFVLTHSNLDVHATRFRMVGRAGTGAQGVDVRFNRLAEVSDLLWEAEGHGRMPSTLTLACERHLFDQWVLAGYAAVRRYFQEARQGVRRLDVLSICARADVPREVRARWLDGARLYLLLFWSRVSVPQAAD